MFFNGFARIIRERIKISRYFFNYLKQHKIFYRTSIQSIIYYIYLHFVAIKSTLLWFFVFFVVILLSFTGFFNSSLFSTMESFRNIMLFDSIKYALTSQSLPSFRPFKHIYSLLITSIRSLLMWELIRICSTDIVIRTSRIYIAWRLLTITVYMIIVISQRHHLFVWSVFSPKLLYEATYSAMICCNALLALIVITVQSAAIPNYASCKDLRLRDSAGNGYE